MYRTRHLLIILLIFLMATSWGRSIEEIKRSGKIYVAFTSSDLKNINYDLALEFARYLNVELIEVEIQWDEAFMRNGVHPPNMETDPQLNYTPDALKKADIICSTFTVMEWRKKLFGFAHTMQSAELLIISKQEETPTGFEDLAGKKIAFTGTTTFEQHLEEINTSIGGGIQLIPTASSDESNDQSSDVDSEHELGDS